MGKNGPEFYDDELVFATYIAAHETRIEGPNDTLEKPVFDELAGNLTNLRILDLGCGNAGFGLEALGQGCLSYLGIDGSTNMAAAAKQKLAGTQGKVIQSLHRILELSHTTIRPGHVAPRPPLHSGD